jgi:hypothetical protein
MPCAACHKVWYTAEAQNRINPAGVHISDPSHIRTRGAFGGDYAWNVLPMCREHHNEWGGGGDRGGAITQFLKKYPWVWRSMQCMGWTYENGKLSNAQENRN